MAASEGEVVHMFRSSRPVRKLSIAALIVLVALPALPPAAATDLTVPAGGLVSIELVNSNAAFRNTLSIVSPAVAVASTGCKLEPAVGLGGVHILSEKLSQRGCRVQLDADPATAGTQAFAAGTVFTFGFCAQTDADADCEYVWSSDAASNPDGFDHLATTPIRAAEYPGQIFQLAWEDLPGGGDLDFDDLVAVVRAGGDADGDGLWDDWEQFGVDTTGDGVVDLDLPALGADPMHKDIFLEVDWMDCALAGSDCAAGDTHNHAPLAGVVNAVVAAFAAAPVTNPDGVNGIDLHVDVNNAMAHQQFLAVGCGFGNSFDTAKATNFGATNPRRFAYHYMIFAHRQAAGDGGSSGCAELPGNDALVTMGAFGGGTGTVAQQAGTLMHEFGHNLNLRHGGSVNTNYKPNYLSIMNYAFQLGGITPDPDGAGPLTGRVDYSRSALPSLNEASLNEPAGVGDGTDNTRYNCPAATIAPASGPIDWNCDGDTTDVGIAVDINGDGSSTVLAGFDDWANLKLDFQNTFDFEDGVHTSNVDLVEADPTVVQQVPSQVAIDIRPGTSQNPVNPAARGQMPVAILSSEGFDAPAEVLVSSLTFGRTGTETSLSFCGGAEDVDGDGRPDLVCHFSTQKAGFQVGTTKGTLRGATIGSQPILGTDSVLVKP